MQNTKYCGGEIDARIAQVKKDAKKEEKGRILSLLEKEYPAITAWPIWKILSEG